MVDKDNDGVEGGLDRRQLLKRTALVGGALVWTTPVVQSISGTALATTGSPGGNGGSGGISYVIVLVKCGTDYYLVKYGDSGSPDCGPGVQASGPQVVDNICRNGLLDLKAIGGANIVAGCPSFPAGSDLTSADLSVDIGSCTLAGYVLHDGQVADPVDASKPFKCYAESSLGTRGIKPANFTLPALGSTGVISFDKL